MRITIAAAALSCILLVTSGAALAQEGNARALQMAKRSAEARDALDFVKSQAARIRDANLRKAVVEILADPTPTWLALHPDAEAREAVRKRLVEAGLLGEEVTVASLFPPVPSQAFLAAPGGLLDRHHGHPGGLAVHTAFNLQAALDLEENYENRYDIELDHDLVIAAPILHDAMKAWALQWGKDGTLTKQAVIAGTASHHVYVVAEALHRKLPPAFVVALASAHAPPTEADAKLVVGWVRAAAILANVDPLAARVLTKANEELTPARLPSIEAVINHLSDHDYVLADPAGTVVADALVRLAKETPEGAKLDEAGLRWARLRVTTEMTHMRLYQWLREGGDARVKAELAKRKIPLAATSDAAP